jgi:hypothetical protein
MNKAAALEAMQSQYRRIPHIHCHLRVAQNIIGTVETMPNRSGRYSARSVHLLDDRHTSSTSLPPDTDPTHCSSIRRNLPRPTVQVGLQRSIQSLNVRRPLTQYTALPFARFLITCALQALGSKCYLIPVSEQNEIQKLGVWRIRKEKLDTSLET